MKNLNKQFINLNKEENKMSGLRNPLKEGMLQRYKKELAKLESIEKKKSEHYARIHELNGGAGKDGLIQILREQLEGPKKQRDLFY